MKSSYMVVTLALVGGFAGGVVSGFVGRQTPRTEAATESEQLSPGDIADVAAFLKVLRQRRVTDDTIATPGKVLELFARSGGRRLQLGTYSGRVARGEAGLPLMGLFDGKERLRLLLRLAGRNESPVLVFKDRSGSDRIVFGLGLSDAGEEPFLATFDATGKKRNIFGKY